MFPPNGRSVEWRWAYRSTRTDKARRRWELLCVEIYLLNPALMGRRYRLLPRAPTCLGPAL